MRSRRAELAQMLGMVGLLLGCASRSEDSDADQQLSEHTAEVALEVRDNGNGIAAALLPV